MALYLLAHVALRLRTGGGLGRGRPVAAAVLVAMIPVATVVPALGALALVALVSVALIAYEVARHRADRAWIRSRRGSFTLSEAMARSAIVQRGRRPRGNEPPDPSTG